MPSLYSGCRWLALDDWTLRRCLDQGMSEAGIAVYLCRHIAEIKARIAEFRLHPTSAAAQ
jgi:hypothetical protein